MRKGLPLATSAEVRSWVREYLRANALRTGCATLLFLLAMTAALIAPQLVGILVQSVREGADTSRVDLIGLVLLVSLVVQATLAGAARAQAAILGEHVLANTRDKFVDRTVRLPLDVVENAGNGDLLSRATSDVQKLNESVRYAVPQIAMALLTIVLTAGAMIWTAPKLALVMLVGTPILVVGTGWYRRRAPQAFEQLLDEWAEVRGGVQETIVGASTVESLRLAGRRRRQNDRIVGKAARTRRRIVKLQTVFLPCLDLGVFLPMAAMVLVGGLAYRHGMVELAALTAMVLYVERLAEPLVDLVSWLDELQMGNAALRRILGVQAIPVDRGSTDISSCPTGQTVDISEVGFSYRASRSVLNNINLSIRAGEFLAVVGASGAGKSTLGKLIAGIHRPTAGVVRIGGVDIDKFSSADLRSVVAMVAQETYIFSGTVRDNLTMTGRADREWSEAELWKALEVGGAYEWVKSLENGLDTDVGTGEVAVPAGEAQSLALARVVLANPLVAVLDEATAELDSSSTQQLETSLVAALRGRTVVAIAHQLSIAQTADRVAYMEGGSVVELGTHAELVDAGGQYAKLWESWQPPDLQSRHEQREICMEGLMFDDERID
ncbi:hypothetical protein CH249_01360 [Rhodococcus sp. 05-2255-3B1]|uniref:ABC transporter ATP-binding protein n=1 Tax=unclassified Rhodococcus (in: high G+C Gram-positive bacteria) TaxID=192944 RepID=UPI000B9C5EA5|nr:MULTISPECIES: ABC transporter ATP-binding protein [unclassified Rhodococcus (in: high G+C Gram-positive bacteria)]OZE13454.1 hypothetical protein CH250_06005 [Rhodococcus sp. 05-2255-3C]OZE15931.1 hypothetical protein CH249_01360 [Rhodococcus sp. 05-2255-3B1]OZE18970.1 hypothetical protein CH255_13385 [Rhodococcus sp. 05-2255-2A2]